MRIVRDVLSLGLALSALLGTLILATDQWLWTAAASHAYGLIAFVVADILMTVALLENVGLGRLVAAFASMAQIGAMVGDFFVGGPTDVASTAFKAYLINDPYYVGLLLIQVIVGLVAVSSVMMPFLEHHVRWTRPAHNATA